MVEPTVISPGAGEHRVWKVKRAWFLPRDIGTGEADVIDTHFWASELPRKTAWGTVLEGGVFRQVFLFVLFFEIGSHYLPLIPSTDE